ncbi:hypothetical protein [Streptomyces sp. NPDC018610]
MGAPARVRRRVSQRLLLAGGKPGFEGKNIPRIINGPTDSPVVGVTVG